MQIKYRFNINGRSINPIWKDDLKKEYEMESSQWFYRANLSGKLSLIREDFDYLDSEDFETEFIFTVEKSDDGGLNWYEYWVGKFFKTDCKWNNDDRKVEIKLEKKDQYNNVLAGLENEYDLIKLAAAKTRLQIDKRPLIQLYIPGDSVVGCFLSGNAWEQDVAFEETDTNKLINDYYFALSSSFQKCSVYGSGSPDCSGEYVRTSEFDVATDIYLMSKNNEYRLVYTVTGPPTSGVLYPYTLQIVRQSDSVALFTFSGQSGIVYPVGNEIELTAIGGSGATGTYTIFWSTIEAYMRYVLDVDIISGLGTYPIPENDIVAYNRNYKRVIGYNFSLITITNDSQVEPTEYGLMDDGNYFVEPYGFPSYPKYYPAAKSTWGLSSLWFNFDLYDDILEVNARKAYETKDSSMISDVIKVLLKEFAPDISHDGTVEFSEFLYGSLNPITNNNFRVMITQKTNITSGEYDRPAQKAPITLGSVFSMLRDTFQCYWYIEDNKLKIEHVSWFKKGGTYSGSPIIGVDLTELIQPRNSKPWGFNTSKYEFDKSDMSERIQFKWMDDVTFAFNGYPIVITSRFVEEGKVDDVNIGDFTTDIDYMLLNPLAVNQEGFAMVAAVLDGGVYKLPYIDRYIDGADLTIQNGLVSWIYLHPNYWIYDLPSYNVIINDSVSFVQGIQRNKKQEVKYPSVNDPDPMQLIKTEIGNGQVEKISVNLSSRMNEIQLKYDTK